jgi:hypothetical protein
MLIRGTDHPIFVGDLIYRRGIRSFEVEPHPDNGVASLLVNELQIEVDEAGSLMYVWGYCPHESWISEPLNEPLHSRGGLQLDSEILVPGVSKQINEERWPVRFDETSGWLCIGDHAECDDLIAFSPGACAAVRTGKLVALWLQPVLVE